VSGYNLPPGVSTRDIDTLGANSDQDRYGNEEDCVLCHRAFIQDTFDQRFYFADDVEYYGFKNLSYSKSIDPFETQGGWICGKDCYNDHAVEADEPEAGIGIHLVLKPLAVLALKAVIVKATDGAE
jgi:hypothetical protein